AESVCRGWQRISIGFREESDPYNDGAGCARRRSHFGAHAERRNVMANRRESLKIIGAIGSTCAFPFSADELYGQHVHSRAASQTADRGPYTPKSFTPAEFEAISQVAERIIPATDTPGAIGAGVPRYIDQVVSLNPEHKRRFQAGLAWIEKESARRFRKPFVKLSEAR